MMIGTFKATDDGYTGELNALGLTVAGMTFCPVTNKKGDGPDFIVIGYGEWDDAAELDHFIHSASAEPFLNANCYDVGAAWKKISKKGKPYLSVKLDGPTLAAPIHCALTEHKDGTFHLIWTRKDRDADADPQAAAA
jgi:uncharacterized protein (DUF736 family)